jgi:hypothetical protein
MLSETPLVCTAKFTQWASFDLTGWGVADILPRLGFGHFRRNLFIKENFEGAIECL